MIWLVWYVLVGMAVAMGIAHIVAGITVGHPWIYLRRMALVVVAWPLICIGYVLARSRQRR